MFYSLLFLFSYLPCLNLNFIHHLLFCSFCFTFLFLKDLFSCCFRRSVSLCVSAGGHFQSFCRCWCCFSRRNNKPVCIKIHHITIYKQGVCRCSFRSGSVTHRVLYWSTWQGKNNRSDCQTGGKYPIRSYLEHESVITSVWLKLLYSSCPTNSSVQFHHHYCVLCF